MSALSGTTPQTEALIFGSHDNSALEMINGCPPIWDTLWGAEMYRGRCITLNGQDKQSQMLISQPCPQGISPPDLKNRPSATLLFTSCEMLQQANALDEREVFSNMRRLAGRTVMHLTCVPRSASRDIWAAVVATITD